MAKSHDTSARAPERLEGRACPQAGAAKDAAGEKPAVPEGAQAGVSVPGEDAPARRGVLITFEGGDGAGKSTHIRYVADELSRAGREVVRLREPGGTPVGESLRRIVLDPAHGELSDGAELLIYEAARAQLVSEVIEPALARGAVVLCDRFTDSTIAYQAYGRGLPIDFVRRANAFATHGIVPDRTILLVCGGARTGLARATGSGAGDRLEQAGEAFHARVNKAFLKLAKRDPKRIRVVHSSKSRRQTAAAVARELVDLLPELEEKAKSVSAVPSNVKGSSSQRPKKRSGRGRGRGARRG